MRKTEEWAGSCRLISRGGQVLGVCSKPEPKNHLSRQLWEHGGFEVMGRPYDTFTIERMLLSKKQFPNPESVHELFDKNELGLIEKGGSRACFGVVSAYELDHAQQTGGAIFIVTKVLFVVGEKDVEVIYHDLLGSLEAPTQEDVDVKSLKCPCCGAELEVQLVKRGTSDVPPNA